MPVVTVRNDSCLRRGRNSEYAEEMDSSGRARTVGRDVEHEPTTRLLAGVSGRRWDSSKGSRCGRGRRYDLLLAWGGGLIYIPVEHPGKGIQVEGGQRVLDVRRCSCLVFWQENCQWGILGLRLDEESE